MAYITKDDVRKAFLGNKMKRHALLYQYYKEEYFYPDYTSAFIAEKIAADLEVKITDVMIRQIRVKCAKSDPHYRAASLPTNLTQQPKENQARQPGKAQQSGKEWIFPNANDLPKKDPFAEAFKDL